jgi:uncharacterized repeat protein (TIGR03803 family)
MIRLYKLVVCTWFCLANLGALAQNKLWFLTEQGGAYNQGALVHVGSSGLGLGVAHSFQSPAGYTPVGKLLLASDGNLYGACYDGGLFASCTIFTFDLSGGGYSDVYDFDIIHGDFPRSGLVEGPNGILYGVASSGGAYSGGVLYSYSLATGGYIDLYSFSQSTGKTPMGCPIIHNGSLYGMTSAGGTSGAGVIYRYDINTAVWTKLSEFNNINGSGPWGSFLVHPNGLFYGVTKTGGAHNFGTLFSFDPSTYLVTKFHDFDVDSGAEPNCTLIAGANGLLYGTATHFGPSNGGVLFIFNTATNQYAVIHAFSGPDGYHPHGELMQQGNELLGLTYYGGSSLFGVMYRYNIITNGFAKLIDFDGTNGKHPCAGFVWAPVPLSVPAVGERPLMAFPNPVLNYCFIPAAETGFSDARPALCDVHGSTVNVPALRLAGFWRFDLGGLPKGIYIMQWPDGPGTRIEKVLKL